MWKVPWTGISNTKVETKLRRLSMVSALRVKSEGKETTSAAMVTGIVIFWQLGPRETKGELATKLTMENTFKTRAPGRLVGVRISGH
jgi:hypothetical protein